MFTNNLRSFHLVLNYYLVSKETSNQRRINRLCRVLVAKGSARHIRTKTYKINIYIFKTSINYSNRSKIQLANILLEGSKNVSRFKDFFHPEKLNIGSTTIIVTRPSSFQAQTRIIRSGKGWNVIN